MITLNGKLLASFNHVWVVPSDGFGTYSKIGVLGSTQKIYVFLSIFDNILFSRVRLTLNPFTKSKYSSVSPKTHMPSIQQNFDQIPRLLSHHYLVDPTLKRMNGLIFKKRHVQFTCIPQLMNRDYKKQEEKTNRFKYNPFQGVFQKSLK